MNSGLWIYTRYRYDVFLLIYLSRIDTINAPYTMDIVKEDVHLPLEIIKMHCKCIIFVYFRSLYLAIFFWLPSHSHWCMFMFIALHKKKLMLSSSSCEHRSRSAAVFSSSNLTCWQGKGQRPLFADNRNWFREHFCFFSMNA